MKISNIIIPIPTHTSGTSSSPAPEWLIILVMVIAIAVLLFSIYAFISIITGFELSSWFMDRKYDFMLWVKKHRNNKK